MSGPTRGFLGRGRAARDPRLPPGQYDTGSDFPEPSGFTVAMDHVVQRVTATSGFAARRTFTGAMDTIPSALWAELLTVF